MNEYNKNMVLRYRPYIYRDVCDPFPIRYVGYTIFTDKQRSVSFPKWEVDPKSVGAEFVIEYAIYYDYDIQHLYDLEHIWVAVGVDGNVCDCWSSFHGMRLRAAGMKEFSVVETHPVLYAQPGKHAMLPAPQLFELHPGLYTSCNKDAGGGLLIPPMLRSEMSTSPEMDKKIHQHILTNYTFNPSMMFEPEEILADQFITWPELLKKIPELVLEQLEIIG